ncbi:MAG: prenyltransferase [Deltaproteobacteria bacterium]|nr:prenyltransferase [Deltaproteobacteria bacterium]
MLSSSAAAPCVPKPVAWLTALRLPFTSVAVVPFVVGAWLAHAHGRLVSMAAALAGTVAVLLICVGCHLFGEAHDQAEDLLTLEHGRNKFSGGTLMVATGVLPALHVRLVAAAFFGVALLLGLYVCWVHSALWLLGLGAFGGATAAVYTVPPVRLVKRGVGELFIGLCYGWLTLVTGYASASGTMPDFPHLAALPIALTVFNIIVINEFPDYEADRDTGKRNLMVRVGKRAGAIIYAIAMVSTVASLVWLCALRGPGSWVRIVAVLLPSCLGLWLAFQVAVRRAWTDRTRLEPAAGATIVLNLVCAVSVGVLLR